MSEENNVNEAEVEAPKITLDDIVTMQKIISIASSRGAFRAEEMSAVGRTYDRIASFVSYNVPEESKEQAKEEGQETSESSEQ